MKFKKIVSGLSAAAILAASTMTTMPVLVGAADSVLYASDSVAYTSSKIFLPLAEGEGESGITMGAGRLTFLQFDLSEYDLETIETVKLRTTKKSGSISACAVVGVPNDALSDTIEDMTFDTTAETAINAFVSGDTTYDLTNADVAYSSIYPSYAQTYADRTANEVRFMGENKTSADCVTNMHTSLAEGIFKDYAYQGIRIDGISPANQYGEDISAVIKSVVNDEDKTATILLYSAYSTGYDIYDASVDNADKRPYLEITTNVVEPTPEPTEDPTVYNKRDLSQSTIIQYGKNSNEEAVHSVVNGETVTCTGWTKSIPGATSNSYKLIDGTDATIAEEFAKTGSGITATAFVIDMGEMKPINKIVVKHVSGSAIIAVAGDNESDTNGYLTEDGFILNKNWVRMNNSAAKNLDDGISVNYGAEWTDPGEKGGYEKVTITGDFGDCRYIFFDGNGSMSYCAEIEVYYAGEPEATPTPIVYNKRDLSQSAIIQYGKNSNEEAVHSVVNGETVTCTGWTKSVPGATSSSYRLIDGADATEADNLAKTGSGNSATAFIIDMGEMKPVDKIVVKHVSGSAIVAVAGDNESDTNGYLTEDGFILNKNWARMNNSNAKNLDNSVTVEYGAEWTDPGEKLGYETVTITGDFGDCRYIFFDGNGSMSYCAEIEVYYAGEPEATPTPIVYNKRDLSQSAIIQYGKNSNEEAVHSAVNGETVTCTGWTKSIPGATSSSYRLIDGADATEADNLAKTGSGNSATTFVIDMGEMKPVDRIVVKHVSGSAIVAVAGDNESDANGYLTEDGFILNKNWARMNNSNAKNLDSSITAEYGAEWTDPGEKLGYETVTLTGDFGDCRYIFFDGNNSNSYCAEIEVYYTGEPEATTQPTTAPTTQPTVEPTTQPTVEPEDSVAFDMPQRTEKGITIPVTVTGEGSCEAVIYVAEYADGRLVAIRAIYNASITQTQEINIECSLSGEARVFIWDNNQAAIWDAMSV